MHGHLLIGPPASGKSTTAKQLASLLPAKVISTDALRLELWGDESHQGSWSSLERLLLQRIDEVFTNGQAVIVDATHARRQWRQGLMRAVERSSPVPVKWTGWWLQTPLETCLLWNQSRKRQVPEPVIRDFFQALNHPKTAPRLDEGFAQLHRIHPPTGDLLNQVMQAMKVHTSGQSTRSPGVKKVEKAVQPPFGGFNV